MVRFLACSFVGGSEARVEESERGLSCLKEREIDELIFCGFQVMTGSGV